MINSRYLTIPLVLSMLFGSANAEVVTNNLSVSATVDAFDANCTVTVPPLDLGNIKIGMIGVDRHYGASKVTVSVSCDQDVSYRIYTPLPMATSATIDLPDVEQTHMLYSVGKNVGGEYYYFSVYGDPNTETVNKPPAVTSTGYMGAASQYIIGNVTANSTTTHDVNVIAWVAKIIETKTDIVGSYTIPLVFEVDF